MNLFSQYLIYIGLWLSGLVPIENFPVFIQTVIHEYQETNGKNLYELEKQRIQIPWNDERPSIPSSRRQNDK